jgi:hypothetical protein
MAGRQFQHRHGNEFKTLQSHFKSTGDFCNCYQDTTDCSVQIGIPHPCDVCKLAFKLSITDGSLVLYSNISLPQKCNLCINIHHRWSRIGIISQNHIAITWNSCHLNAREFSYSCTSICVPLYDKTVSHNSHHIFFMT